MGIKNLFSKRSRDEVLGSKVLVCSLDPKFAEMLSTDAASYGRFYPTLTATTFASIEALLGRLVRDMTSFSYSAMPRQRES